MKEKLAFCVLYALLIIFLSEVNCIKITDDYGENSTVSSTASSLASNESTLSFDVTNEKNLQEARIINDSDNDGDGFDDDDSKFSMPTPTATSNIHKIPPTLQNAKKKIDSKEKPEKSLKDFANAKPAQVVNTNILPDGKLKQAILNSKQQSFKNLVDKSTGKLKDQIARPAEVQADFSKELPPPESTAKHFIPSPELSPIYSTDNQSPDHFQPLNQYMRPPTKDAYFPFENSYNSHVEVEQKWFGGNRSPADHTHPNDVVPNIFNQQQQQHGRNTHIEYPPQHANFQRQFPQYHSQSTFSHQFNQQPQQQKQFFGGSGERMVFPTDSNVFNDDVRGNWPPKLPDFGKKVKGSWKWVPEGDDDEEETTEGRFQSYHSSPVIYDAPRPHTVRDRPYSFETSDVFGQHTTPPTGPSTSHAWPTAEALMTGEEIATTGKSDESEKGQLDVKLLRSPSPWKKLIHVMTAAIPIGLIISALTPRIVYVHPNATAPTLQPPLSQQQPPPAIPPSAPSQSFQQLNSPPYPLRQRAILAPSTYDVRTSLTDFMKFMEMQYRERRGNIDGTCEDRFFCEMALMGARPDANMMHRTLYTVALETTSSQAEKSGLKEIFAAIKRHNCDTFKCNRVS